MGRQVHSKHIPGSQLLIHCPPLLVARDDLEMPTGVTLSFEVMGGPQNTPITPLFDAGRNHEWLKNSAARGGGADGCHVLPVRDFCS